MNGIGALAALVLVAAWPANRGEELSFHGEVVEVDIEGSRLVVKARKAEDWVEMRFEIDDLTEIRARGLSELSPGDPRREPVPITPSDLEVGDHVEIRYRIVHGKNVAKLIERNRAGHA